MTRFPIIDLQDYLDGVAGADSKAAADVRDAFENVGFMAVIHHGISWSKVEALAATAAAFHARPMAWKQAMAFSADFTGYVAPEAHSIQTSTLNDNTKGDLNEAYFMERERPPANGDPARRAAFASPNQWPDDVDGFRAQLLDYFETIEKFARHLLPLYELALDLPAGFFEPAFCWPQASLRLSHYPPVPAEDNQFGISPHTDAGFLTILPQSAIAGLHIRPAGQDWIPAPTVAHGLFINSGDMLKRWTNDRFRSTEHMAVNSSGRERYATPFFFSPDVTYEMSCLPSCQSPDNPPKYEPITYGEYRKWFMDANYRSDLASR